MTRRERRDAGPLVDTDVHETLASHELLLPYLQPYWQRVMTQYQTQYLGSTTPSNFPYTPPTPGAGRLDWVPADVPMASTVELLRRHLFDGEGVTTAILNGFFYPSSMVGNFELAAALAAAYNDWQVEHWLERDPRLCGSVHVVAADPQEAAREIDRVAAHPQIVQVFLPTVVDRQYGDPYYRPILQAAVRNGLAVALHHNQTTETVLGFPRYYFEWHTVAAPHAAQNQLLSLVANGVFDELPELRVVLLETGVAWLPWFMWRIDQQYREIRVDIPWVKRLPSEHLRDCVRIATQPMGDVKPAEFLRLIEMVDSERMYVFSTDYPHYDADSAEHVLPATLPAELRERIRYRNALETFPRLAGLLSPQHELSA